MRRPSLVAGFAFPLALALGTGACSGPSTSSAPQGSGAPIPAADAGSGNDAGLGVTPADGGGGGSFVFEAGVDEGVQTDACTSVTLKSTLIPGHIVVVFDQSDSMKNPFVDADGGSSVPKWQAAENALVAAVSPIQADLTLGAAFVPTGANGACTVAPLGTSPQISIESAPTFLSDFQAHFAASGWKTIDGTPLELGLEAADTALTPAPPGQSAVVVLTDGAPNCGLSTLAQVEPPVVDMAARGIKTYVIGLPGSANAATLLNGLAAAGGTAQSYSPGDPTDLQTQLATIATGTVDPCVVTLSPPPTDASQVHLIVTDAADPGGVQIPPSSDAGGDGWTLSQDGTTATLLGQTCTDAKTGVYTSVTFLYGCSTVPQ